MSLFSAIPAEIFTATLSSVVAMVGSIISTKMRAASENHRMLMEKAGMNLEMRKVANTQSKYKDVRWTRRTIAISVIGAGFVWPLLAPIFNIPVTMGWTELQGGFWPFTSAKENMIWHSVTQGVVLTPLVTHTVAMIIGFYFGGSISENSK